MEAKLIVTRGNASKREIELKLPMTVGRGREAGLTVAHPTVSRIHCELYELDGAVVVRDNNSTNGTFIGNERVHHRVLRPDEELTIGPLTFKASYKHSGAYPKLEDEAEEAASADTPTANFLNETVPNPADEIPFGAAAEDAASAGMADDDEMAFDFLADEPAAAAEADEVPEIAEVEESAWTPAEEVADEAEIEAVVQEPAGEETASEAEELEVEPPTIEDDLEFDFLGDETSAPPVADEAPLTPPAAAQADADDDDVEISFNFETEDNELTMQAPTAAPLADEPAEDAVEEIAFGEDSAAEDDTFTIEEDAPAASTPSDDEFNFDALVDETVASTSDDEIAWQPEGDDESSEEPTIMADDFTDLHAEEPEVAASFEPKPAKPAKAEKPAKPEKPAKSAKAKRSWWPFGKKKKKADAADDYFEEEPADEPKSKLGKSDGKKPKVAERFEAMPAEPLPDFGAAEEPQATAPVVEGKKNDAIVFEPPAIDVPDEAAADAAAPEELDDFFRQLGMKK